MIVVVDYGASNLKSIVLRTTSKAGPAGDNWNMASFQARAVGISPELFKPMLDKVVATSGAFGFTPKKNELTVPCKP